MIDLLWNIASFIIGVISAGVGTMIVIVGLKMIFTGLGWCI